MGGEVLELLDDRAERLKREGLNQGREEMVAAMAELGYSQQTIDEVLSALDRSQQSSRAEMVLPNFVPRDIDASDIMQAVRNGELR